MSNLKFISNRTITTKVSKEKLPKVKSLYQQLRPFIKFARPEFRIIGYSLGLLLISSSVTMSVPFSMGAIIDIVMQKEEIEGKSAGDGENDNEYPLKSSKFLRNMFAQLGSLPALFGTLAAVFVGLCCIRCACLF